MCLGNSIRVALVRQTDPGDLLIDSDGPALDDRTLRARLDDAGYRVRRIQRERSPSGRGWHLMIATTPIPATPHEVILLQLLCGSDPRREANNMRRVRHWGTLPPAMRDAWNVLYQ